MCNYCICLWICIFVFVCVCVCVNVYFCISVQLHFFSDPLAYPFGAVRPKPHLSQECSLRCTEQYLYQYFCNTYIIFALSNIYINTFATHISSLHWAISISILLRHIYHLCTEQYLHQYFCNTYIIFALSNIYINIICALETQFIVIWFTNNNNFATDPIIIHSIEVHWCIIVWMYIFTTWYVP